MVPYQEPQPGVITLPLLSPEEAGEVLEVLKAPERWQPARVSGEKHDNVESKTVRSATVSSLQSESDAGMRSLFEARIKSIVRPLVFKRWKLDLVKHSPIQLVRYVSGDFYIAHRDNTYPFTERYYTVVCYLNSDFEGGGTYFPDSDFTVEPAAGKAVIFPSDYLHKANTVSSGVKYIAVSWMLNNPPVEWI